MSLSISDRLVAAARSAADHAYCPYSDFPVGSAVETHDGSIHGGCNVENASYGLACCAERNALFAAIAAGARPGDIRAIAIYTPGDRAFSSCGACRQVIVELAAPDACVESFCDVPGVVLRYSAGDLLPGCFTLPVDGASP